MLEEILSGRSDLRTLSPTFYVLTKGQARETFRGYNGGGNCYPPAVRALAGPNDFSALSGGTAIVPIVTAPV
jgi:hypothetical protein